MHKKKIVVPSSLKTLGEVRAWLSKQTKDVPEATIKRALARVR